MTMHATGFGDGGSYQHELLAPDADDDMTPRLPTNLVDLEEAARRAMQPRDFSFLAATASSGATVVANRAAFDRWGIVPRILRDVTWRDHAVTILGTAMAAPVMLAPIGALTVAHPDGELAVARAAAELGLTMVVSPVSSYTLEDIAAAAGGSTPWMELVWTTDQQVNESILDRASAAGYTVLTVSVDLPVTSWRPAHLDHRYLPLLRGVGLANYIADPAFQARLPAAAQGDPQAAIRRWAEIATDPGRTWKHVGAIRKYWDGPIVLKGVLHPDDAQKAVDWGMDGIIVSNHGGRQLDGSIASLDALPAIVGRVGDQTTVLMDSGVRTGSDIVKALALGAHAVLIGRPYAFGLGLAGYSGVLHVLRSLLCDYDLSMAVAGHASPRSLAADTLAPVPGGDR